MNENENTRLSSASNCENQAAAYNQCNYGHCAIQGVNTKLSKCLIYIFFYSHVF